MNMQMRFTMNMQ